MNQKILWKIESLWEKFYTKNNIKKDNFKVHSFFSQKNNFSFKEGEVCFSDDYGSYRGLKNNEYIQNNGKYIYLFDNHNKMIFPLFDYFSFKNKAISVVHIDAHSDDAFFEHKKETEFTEENIVNIYSHSRISDFFDALSKTNTISYIHRFCDSDSFLHKDLPKENFLLSLDIDIFGPEGDFVDLELKVKKIAEAWARADVICIATSPGFIDQDFAHEIIKILIK